MHVVKGDESRRLWSGALSERREDFSGICSRKQTIDGGIDVPDTACGSFEYDESCKLQRLKHSALGPP
jgi:hypothetical protein